jgi:hypothetical protein
MSDFNLERDTVLKGTVFRVGQIVRGDCEDPACRETDAVLYDTLDDPTLLCVWHSRARSKATPRSQACDRCGSTGNVWRDPVHRRNEYLCINCHDPESLFQNRWANKVRQSSPLHDGPPRAVCAAAGYGTECKGEIKWRGAHNMSLCNKHAGKQSAGPN